MRKENGPNQSSVQSRGQRLRKLFILIILLVFLIAGLFYVFIVFRSHEEWVRGYRAPEYPLPSVIETEKPSGLPDEIESEEPGTVTGGAGVRPEDPTWPNEPATQ